MNDDSAFEGNGSMFNLYNKDIYVTFLTTKLLSLASVKFSKLGFTNRKTALAINFHLLSFGGHFAQLSWLTPKIIFCGLGLSS